MRLYLKIFLFITIFFTQLFATQELQNEYFIDGQKVMLSNIVKSPKTDEILFNINPARHSKRVQASELIKRLDSYGYRGYHAQHTIIQFSQKSHINTKLFKESIQSYYKERYPGIVVEEITIKPLKYLTKLPKEYTLFFKKRAYLTNQSLFFLKTLDNKKIFFNYTLLAKTPIYFAKKNIAKGEEISHVNTEKKSIILHKFRAMPLVTLQKGRYEAKHQIKRGSLLTQRDMTQLYLVKRGTEITVTLHNEGISIIFYAEALKSGHINDTIPVRYKNKKIPVRITGKNRAEVK
jgi:flagella basal body P-ring formation protein FlgA